jgi:DNA-binding transcriptional LysR family regulator
MKRTDRIGVKLRDLHIALAVAEAGSMTRTAEELAVSYPVVSKTISELEHTLGVKLFDRSKAGSSQRLRPPVAQIRSRGVR